MNNSNSFQRFTSAQALKNYLVEEALESYDGLFGEEFNGYFYPFTLEATPIGLDAVAVSAPPSNSDSSNFSETNTQVDGVDEADLIETDGQFIYQVNGQLLTIVDARNETDLDIVTQFSFDPNARSETPNNNGTSDLHLAIDYFYPVNGWSTIDGMYLQGDRLTVIASGWSPLEDQTAVSDTFYYPGYSGVNEVQVTVFDVANPNNINVLERTTLEGSLITSRAIGDEVFVVTSHNFQLPGPEIIPDPESSTDTPSDEQGASDSNALPTDALVYPSYPGPSGTYETQEQYLERIEGRALDLALPNVATIDGKGQDVTSGLLSQPTDIYLPLDEQPWQLTSVSTFDVGDNHLGVDEATSIPTDWVGEVFVSKDSLYLLRTHYQGNKSTTEILQYDLESSALVAKGEVPGSIDNQFSVDEYEGFLRISTTTGFGNNSSNNVYVLERESSTLDIVGKVENLAPGERIFSTRFQGEYGFVVTFRQVDPLFALDLSNPTNPVVKGELKIPGFSEYLQVIEDGDRRLLLGVGRDADPDTGQADSLKVSLFDVTDLANLTEIDNYIFEGDFTYSEALWDHLAITYSPVHKLLAIPAQYYNYQEYSSETKLHVFEVDGTDGLSSLGEVDHGEDWINRSLYIDDTLFAVSSQEISAHHIPTLKELDSVSWSGQGQGEEIVLPVDSAPFIGRASDEVISGSGSRDVINGQDGYDEIYGEQGNDQIHGNKGDDQLFGGPGKDFLKGGYGDDQLSGAKGNDFLKGGKGKDILHGGAGHDRLKGGPDADELTGGGGRDRFYIKKLRHSLLKAYDAITDLTIGKDKIKGRYAVAAEDLRQLGAIDDLQPQTIRTVLTRAAFDAKGAATFTMGNETFLALNNKGKGFQAQTDAIIKITGFSGSLEELQIF